MRDIESESCGERCRILSLQKRSKGLADEPDSVAPVTLRRIDAKLDRISDDMRDLKVRATATEEAIAGVNRRLDRIEMCVERIEKRLDLVEA
jgi:hypothetical protein